MRMGLRSEVGGQAFGTSPSPANDLNYLHSSLGVPFSLEILGLCSNTSYG